MSDDPDRVVCRSPCHDTVARPAKRLKDHHDVPRPASRVAAPEVDREPVGVAERVDKGGAVSEPQIGAAAGSSLDAVPALQRQITDLDGDNLPSDVVGTPVPPGSGLYAFAVAVILWIGVAMADVSALIWYTWDLLATVCGKPLPRCKLRCRCVVDGSVYKAVLPSCGSWYRLEPLLRGAREIWREVVTPGT